jgi:GNAT superfamily N-acetyltransferase
MGNMTIVVNHGPEAQAYAAQVERRWDTLAERANRGPAISTTVIIENNNKPIGSMNIYGACALEALPGDIRISQRTRAFDSDPASPHVYYGCKEMNLRDYVQKLPLWIADIAYVGDVIVLEEHNRNKGLGSEMVASALQYQRDIAGKPIRGFGITTNPAMLALAEKLGANKSEGYVVLGLDEQQRDLLPRMSQTQDRVVLQEIGLTDSDGTFRLAMIEIYFGDDLTSPSPLAVAIPEHAITNSINHRDPNEDNIGQMLVILNPKLTLDQIKSFEHALSYALATHRWTTVIQKNPENTQKPYSGKLLKKEDTTVFEIPIS